jgi:hypothetical protein
MVISRPVTQQLTTTHPRPDIGGGVVKGLAKHGNRLRHVLRDKCVDANLFWMKRGYSPMTHQFYQQHLDWFM